MAQEKTNPDRFKFYKTGNDLAFQIEPICEELEKKEAFDDKTEVVVAKKKCRPHSDTPERLVELFNATEALAESHGFKISVFGGPESMLKSLLKKYPKQDRLMMLEEERIEWSMKTFKESTALSSLEKAKEEIRECAVDITTGEITAATMEYADILMCVFDSAARFGVTPTEIVDAFEKKLEINKQRTWIKNENNTYSHEKTES